MTTENNQAIDPESPEAEAQRTLELQQADLRQSTTVLSDPLLHTTKRERRAQWKLRERPVVRPRAEAKANSVRRMDKLRTVGAEKLVQLVKRCARGVSTISYKIVKHPHLPAPVKAKLEFLGRDFHFFGRQVAAEMNVRNILHMVADAPAPSTLPSIPALPVEVVS